VKHRQPRPDSPQWAQAHLQSPYGTAGLGRGLARALEALVLGGVLLAFALASQAEISPRVNATEVYAHTPFSVTFEFAGSAGAVPDLGPLAEDFTVLGHARSSHLSLEGGAMRRRQQLTLTLVPRREGTLRLPALTFGSERSSPLELSVQAQATLPGERAGLTLEVVVEPATVFVQEQVLVAVRVVRPNGLDLDSARLSEPMVSGGDAVIETLGKDRAYRTERDGNSFEVIERRYALIPQTSGELTIEPMQLDARRVSGGLSLSDPFGVRIDPIQLRSEARRISVRRAPDGEAASLWLPARSLTLTEAWSGLDEAGHARAGEPIVRTIGILAEGISAAQLPALHPAAPAGVNQYPDSPHLATQRNPDGLSAQRTERLVLIPTQAEAVELPAITLRWWNLATASPETARLPARRVEVMPAIGATVAMTPTPTAPEVPMGADRADEPAGAPSPAAADEPEARRPEQGTPAQDGWRPLGWLALGVLLGAFLTRAVGRRGRSGVALPATDSNAGGRQAVRLLARVAEAADRNDADAAQRGLLALTPFLIRAGDRPSRSLGGLLQGLPDGSLRSAVAELQRHRYGAAAPGQGPWDGRALREALRGVRLPQQPVGASTQVSGEELPAFNPR